MMTLMRPKTALMMRPSWWKVRPWSHSGSSSICRSASVLLHWIMVGRWRAQAQAPRLERLWLWSFQLSVKDGARRGVAVRCSACALASLSQCLSNVVPSPLFSISLELVSAKLVLKKARPAPGNLHSPPAKVLRYVSNDPSQPSISARQSKSRKVQLHSKVLLRFLEARILAGVRSVAFPHNQHELCCGCT